MKHRMYAQAVLFGLIISMLPETAFATKDHPHKKHCVDYVIIGSGAGAVIAKRLTDNKKISAVLLEEGDNNTQDAVLLDPASNFSLSNLFYPQYFYQGRGLIQEQLGGGFYDLVTARTLGGGSQVNGIQVVRGTAEYWQKIADRLGNDWSVDNVFRRYKDLETYINTTGGPISPSRGTSGPWVNATVPSVVTPDAQYLVDAFAQVTGLPAINDYNDPATPVGPFPLWDTQIRPDGEGSFVRESTAYAFLGADVVTPEGKGVNGRKLTVEVRATAIALLFDEKESNKVIGVRYSKNGECFDVYARKEVIVSAGLQSPAFLQRNGIGPKDVLEKAGVPVRLANENVGRHMHNHVGVFTAILAPGGFQFVPENEPWASTYGPGAFLPANPALSKERQIQWIVGTSVISGSPEIMLCAPLLLVPESEGTVSIQNDDPFKVIAVNENYLSNPLDEQRIIEALRSTLVPLNDYFAQNPPPSGGPSWQLINPSPDIINDDQAISEFIKGNLAETFHYVATNRMGTDPATSVTDAHGRVHGIKGLRVADNSILPINPDGNTCTPSVLVGWTISEFILAEHKKHCLKK